MSLSSWAGPSDAVSVNLASPIWSTHLLVRSSVDGCEPQKQHVKLRTVAPNEPNGWLLALRAANSLALSLKCLALSLECG